jgi:phosphate transport system substrate-binding protein
MKTLVLSGAAWLTMVCASSAAEPAPPPIRLQATPALEALAKDIVRPLREHGIEIKLIESAGNSQVVTNLGEGQIEAGLLTRPLNGDEQVSFPAHHFMPTTIGTQAVAVVVARAVWESGIHALKRSQIAQLYESRVRSWKELGGENRPLVFFEPAHDRGPWEIFATWVYGDTRRAPAVPWQVVADGPDTQSALQFASGGISVAGVHWADGKDVFPLTLIDDSGKSVEASKPSIADGSYPLTRPIILMFAEEPAAIRRKFQEFMVGEEGQHLVGTHDFIPQSALR